MILLLLLLADTRDVAKQRNRIARCIFSIYHPSFYLGMLVILHIHFNSNFDISNYKKKILLIAFINEIL